MKEEFGRLPSAPGLRPFGAEPAAQSQAEPLVPSAGVAFYRSGSCRNDPRAMDHTYAEMEDGELWPMCGYGWNRSNGTRFSIFRGSPGTEGECKLCRKNVAEGKLPLTIGFPHKTRWL